MAILERYLLYLKNESSDPSHAPVLLQDARRRMPTDTDIVIRDVRIARRYFEFDISVSQDRIMEEVIKILSTIAEFDSCEKVTEENWPKEEAINKARELFNMERYWKTHEVLEQVWKKSEGSEKQILNGIILVAAALVHFQKAEYDTCVGILKRAYGKIETFSGNYHGINIDSLKVDISKIIDTGKIKTLTL
jgi:predicted metal-dependent hydrolase